METKERPIVDSVDTLETAIRRVREGAYSYHAEIGGRD